MLTGCATIRIDEHDMASARSRTEYAAVRMLARRHGSILLTGATASVKGLPGSTPFALGKFALRGMAQCMARELALKNTFAHNTRVQTT
jgi:NAD(P)-dependent dehydrogenase (short-subunit alcohol dehydrogenase family)